MYTVMRFVFINERKHECMLGEIADLSKLVSVGHVADVCFSAFTLLTRFVMLFAPVFLSIKLEIYPYFQSKDFPFQSFI